MVRIAHIADIHYRSLARHAEYRRAFTLMFDELRELKPDAIVLCGDIVHSKTQGISPELIDELTWFFRSCVSVAETHMILGNHDLALSNAQRQDAISPVVSALNEPRLHLYKKSGVYPGPCGTWLCVYSIADEAGWSTVTPVNDAINIALYHGSVRGAMTDVGWELDSDVDVAFFKGYQFVMLGDIHKNQNIAYRNSKPYVAYPGSSIQQDHGEDTGKGYLFWSIRSPDDFDVEFKRIPHDREFRTFEWMGSVNDTLVALPQINRGTRVRIRSRVQLTNADVRQLTKEIIDVKGASEIAFKDDSVIDTSSVTLGDSILKRRDLRDKSIIASLMKQHVGEQTFTANEWVFIEKLIESYITRIVHDDATLRGATWSLRDLRFGGIFGYGVNNRIDFSTMSGITGIFGPNRAGKSSIIGVLMYALFNGTDRGSIKNIDVINTRHQHCEVSLVLEIGGKLYRIERQSARHQNRSGAQHAVTSLNLAEIDRSGAVIADLNGEQRTDTEKSLRMLVGTSDDVMLTGFSVQGDVNRFIDAGPAHRDLVISRLLDLGLFERMSQFAKDESASIRALVKDAPDRDWNSLIISKGDELSMQKAEVMRLETIMKQKQQRLETLSVELASASRGDVVTQATVDAIKRRLDERRERRASLEARRIKEAKKHAANEMSHDDLSCQLASIPIDERRKQVASIEKLRSLLSERRSVFEKENQVLAGQTASIARLSEVPCGDAFPTCKYISDSHRDKQQIEHQRAHVQSLLSDITDAQSCIDELQPAAMRADIEKFALLEKELHKLKINLLETMHAIASIDVDVAGIDRDITSLEIELTNAISNVSDDTTAELKNEIDRIRSQLAVDDAQRIRAASRVGALASEIKRLGDERDKHAKLVSSWRLYDAFIQATSKKGIPATIINSQLPIINAEIARILHGVVDYTVTLDKGSETNSTEVYIDYGDSKRLIELASGMEKMMASLAIRVALMSVSSLPRPDIFVVDEGFGTLDVANIEACTRMLMSLKKTFRHVVVISHIDSIKDIADNMLEVTREGKDARVVFE